MLPAGRCTMRRFGYALPPAPNLLLLLLLFVVDAVDRASQELQMLSKGHVIVADAGREVEAPCEYESVEFSMFENPVIWKKLQAEEETSVNIMGNILDPFLATGRFEVVFASNPPRYQMTLRISDLKPEDSGNYTCEIRGHRSTVLAVVGHLISVRAPVSRVSLEVEDYPPPLQTSVDDAVYRDDRYPPADHRSRVTFVEGAPRTVGCVAYDGFPLPEMQIYLGGADFTGEFVLSQSVTLEGPLGLRSIRYRTERRADKLALTSRDDGRTLRCVVNVPGLESNHTQLHVDVLYRPVITCPMRTAYVGERNVALRCEVSARPSLSALFWIIDVNGTTVAEGQVVNEYWTLVMDRSDGVMETKLFMKQVLPNSFRRYTLVAENSIAASTADALLVHKLTPTTAAAVPPVTEIVQGDVLVQPRDVVRRRNNHNPGYVYIRSSASSAAGCPRPLTLLSFWPHRPSSFSKELTERPNRQRSKTFFFYVFVSVFISMETWPT